MLRWQSTNARHAAPENANGKTWTDHTLTWRSTRSTCRCYSFDLTFLIAGIRACRACYVFCKKWDWEADCRHKIGQGLIITLFPKHIWKNSISCTLKKSMKMWTRWKRIRYSTSNDYTNRFKKRTSNHVLSIFRRNQRWCIWYRYWTSLSRPHPNRPDDHFVIYSFTTYNNVQVREVEYFRTYMQTWPSSARPFLFSCPLRPVAAVPHIHRLDLIPKTPMPVDTGSWFG